MCSGVKMRGYRIALHKAYFDQGYGFTSLAKYILAGMGLAIKDPMIIFWIGLSYAFFCYLFGMILYKIGYVEAVAEVSNQYNLFQKEMRAKFK